MAQKKYTDGSGVSEIWLNIKNYVYSQLLGKADASHTHTKSEITDFPSLATVATSGSYNDLSNKPTIPTVNNATLTIQKNGTNVKTFTANASSNVTANITVPTKTSELTNDSGFLTSHQSLSNYSTLANTIKSLSISGRTITYTKGDNSTGTLTTQDNNTWTAMKGATSSANGSVGYVNAVPPKDGYNTKYLRADGTWQVPPDHTYTVNNATLTIQKNGTTIKTFTANASSNVTCNITVPTKVSELDNDSNYLTSIPNLDASKITSGTIDIARLPQGALERLVTVTNKTARFALTTSSVQLGDVVKQTDTGVMYYVVDTANLNSEDGYSEFTAGTATSVPWSGVSGKPSSYKPSSHTHGNITNAGAVGTTANKPLITTTKGVITTGSFGTTANTFCQGNDSRLSDARTPTAHTHSASDITSGLATVATSGSYNDLLDKPTIPSPYTPPTFTYDSSTETLSVSNTHATVFNYDANSETLEIQING